MRPFSGVLWLLTAVYVEAGQYLPGGVDDSLSALETVSRGNQQFSFDLLKAVNSGKRNGATSPLSLFAVLGLLSQGAQGTTKEQILKAAHLPADDDVIRAGFKALLAPMTSTANYTLDLADAAFIEKTFPVKTSFRDVARTVFLADSEAADFAANTSGTIAAVNQWVRDSTGGNIRRLLDSGDVNSHSEFLLANTLYFKGTWEHDFNASQTRRLPFHVDRVTSVEAEMMTTTGDFDYAYLQELDAEVLALDYKGGEVRLVVVLPGEVDGLETLLSRISSLDQIRPSGSPVKVDVTLPKFRMERELDCIPVLQELGIRDVFTTAADLSSVSDTPALTVTQVKQKAVLEVSEEGTITVPPAHDGSQPMIRVFSADRGFLYLLEHVTTGSVMLLGTYTEP